MIIATRTGVIIYADSLTQEQKEQAWAMVFAAFLKVHSKVISIDVQDAEDDSTDHM